MSPAVSARTHITGPLRGRALGAGLIAAALVMAAPVWWLVVLPVLAGVKSAAHAGHYPIVIGHALGGTAMLMLGAAALYVGWTRNFMRWHRWIGGAYLLGGGVGAGAGVFLSFMNPHPLPGVAVATSTLGATWLAVAGMAFRAARNRRYDSHREWMVRSYVLTWTFVFCRMVMRTPAVATADPATVVGVIWATWITPLIACEIVLQWGRGSRLDSPVAP